ncbi:MAG: DUF362 domain-containing protein [Chitinivibrionia bacterium]|nr:DUF362 domain-containing protein [Chitinivibrionia bacterium]
MDRRSFLRLAAASALAAEWLPAPDLCARESSRVACITDPVLAKSREPAPERLQRLVDRSVTTLTGIDDAGEAWRSLFAPNDVVGIKVNCLAGRGNSTNPEVVEAIAASLRRIGIPGERIIVWDRSNRDLLAAGFKPGARGAYRCFGTDEAGYDDRLFEEGSVGGLLSTILTSLSSAIINVPVLKGRGITGVSLSMKNHYGSIHNPNKYHPNGGDPYIADLNSIPMIRKKQRLIICDCLNGQCNGGPAYDPRWSWREGSMLAARDPVALDATALAMIERKRAERGLPALAEEKRFPAYIGTAAEINGLGNASRDSIELVREET